jgi:hypothetical protein
MMVVDVVWGVVVVVTCAVDVVVDVVASSVVVVSTAAVGGGADVSSVVELHAVPAMTKSRRVPIGRVI